MLHDFIAVELPADTVQRVLLDGDGLFAQSAARAVEGADELRLRVRPFGSGVPVSKLVRVRTGAPVRKGAVLTVPLLWEAVGTPALFPRLDATLEITPVGPSFTQLTLYGRYDPPLGKVGEHLDRLALHSLAEHTVRAFLADLAQRVTAGADGRADGPGVPARMAR